MEDYMVHVYYGEGKGKTTAAMGLAIRAAGNGKSVIIVQFLKGRKSGEICILKRLPEVIILRSDTDYGFYKDMTQETKEILIQLYRKYLEKVWEMTEKKESIVILDEIFSAYQYGMLEEELVKKIIEKKGIEVICTGRNPNSYFLKKADYITQMKKEKHPYDKGVLAREGIEF